MAATQEIITEWMNGILSQNQPMQSQGSLLTLQLVTDKNTVHSERWNLCNESSQWHCHTCPQGSSFALDFPHAAPPSTHIQPYAHTAAQLEGALCWLRGVFGLWGTSEGVTIKCKSINCFEMVVPAYGRGPLSAIHSIEILPLTLIVILNKLPSAVCPLFP